MNLFALITDIRTIIDNKNPQNITMLMQELINAMDDAGIIVLPAKLVPDGVFGLTTFAAIKILLAKFGFNLAEPLATIVYNLLATWLPKMSQVVTVK